MWSDESCQPEATSQSIQAVLPRPTASNLLPLEYGYCDGFLTVRHGMSCDYQLSLGRAARMIPAPARHAPKRTLNKIRELRAESLMSLNGSGRQVLKQWSSYPNNYYLIDRIELLVRPLNACAKWRCDARNAQPQSSARSRSEPVSGFSPEVDSEAFPRLFHGMPSRRWF